MSKAKQKPNRDVILTPEGLKKLQEAKSELEYKTNCG